MAESTITLKIKITPNESDVLVLNNTVSAYRLACNYVSDYIFKTHDLKQASLNKSLYYFLKEKFGLRSQMTQSVMKTVIARYKTILENQKKWIKPKFKKNTI